MSRGTETKAATLVNDGHVTVNRWTLEDDGRISTAIGYIHSDTNTYWVTIDPTGGICTCTFGERQRGREHSHTQALRIAAQTEQRNQ